GGVPDQLAVTGQQLLFAIINGFTLDETTELGVEVEGPPDEQAANAARDYVSALPPEQFPNLIAVAGHFGHVDNDQRFELLIDLFVDGLAQRVQAQAKAADSQRERRQARLAARPADRQCAWACLCASRSARSGTCSASSAASAVVAGTARIKPIEPTSVATAASATASVVSARTPETCANEKMRRVGSAAPV